MPHKTVLKNLLALVFLLSLIGNLNAQSPEKFTISGYIEDIETGEKLIGANVFIPAISKGTTTNTFGFYSVTLPSDSIIVTVSYVGYQTKYYRLLLDKDLTMNFKMGNAVDMETVEVVAEKLVRIEEETQMSRMEVPIDQIKKLPAFLGEVDVLKTLQLLPGVQSGGEGTSGLYVRGGSPDQNLILLDGVPVYNASHLFGFFSVFNADAIKNVSLTKGGFPARYGGRLSSVLEINMKEGNNKEFKAQGSIGLISSKATIEGPIIKDKTSFIVSGRRTYIDLLARPIIVGVQKSQNPDGEVVIPGYFFYDVNAKVNHTFNDKHRLFLSMYTGKDKFSTVFRDETDEGEKYESSGGLDWGNITSAARWNYMWNNKLFSNVTATYSKYQFDIGIEENNTYFEDNELKEDNFSAKYFSGIEDFGAKIDFDYHPDPNHFIRFGANVTHHTFSPGAFQFQQEIEDFNMDTIFASNETQAMDYALYIEDDLSIGNSFKANVGLHASAFSVNGTNYFSLQPRIGMRYLLPGKVAIKASYAAMTQFIHLLTNEGIGLPTDLWVPTTENVLPQQSWQVALGVAKTFKDDFEISIEGYYKPMKNLVSYKEGADFLSLNESWENKVEQGEGLSYGGEFFVQKKRGKTTGWVGYTLSWTDRQFENINGGERFPYKYDRRHDLSVVVSHEFNERITLSGAWVYGTGNAITLPKFRYYAFEPWSNQFNYAQEIQVSDKKNDYRMAPYHRLDVSIEFTKKKKRYERTWVFGLYNAYNRQNPFFIDARDEYEFDPVTGNSTVDRKFVQVSLFPVLPAVAWNFKF